MLNRLIRRTIAGLGLAAVALGASPAPAQRTSSAPKPALWQVSDRDTTVYLFGTIHLLPRNSTWRTKKFDDAVQRSQSLVLETLIDNANPQQLAGLMSQMGFRAGLPPIATRVSAEKRPQLEAAIARTRIPRAMFDRMETWTAAFTLMGVQFAELGLQGEQGVETVLKQSFTAASKPVGELETNREQLAFFDTLPEQAQRGLLEGSIENPGNVRGKFDGMLNAWLSGDVESIAETFNHDLQNSPELRAALLTRRNYSWSQWIERRMAQPGTLMIAVGAGHLAGDISVQRYLESRGYRVKRIQ
jgi:uncharacterized protein YbaP (TraB family)